MGSFQYAKHITAKKENIIAMFSIESMGYYKDTKNSQKYPFPFNFFYPNKANFIAFIGNISSRQLVRESIRSFRNIAQFPSEGFTGPAAIPGVA